MVRQYCTVVPKDQDDGILVIRLDFVDRELDPVVGFVQSLLVDFQGDLSVAASPRTVIRGQDMGVENRGFGGLCKDPAHDLPVLFGADIGGVGEVIAVVERLGEDELDLSV